MKIFFVLVGLALVTACGNSNTSVVDRQVLEEIEQREPKRVLPNQLVRSAYQMGRTLSDELLLSAVNQYAANTTSASFVEYLAQQRYDTLSARVNWINPTSDTLRLTSYEQQLWSAYRYSAERGDPIADNVQRLSGDSLLYTQPLVLTDSLQQRLPASADTLGQLLGMWSITLPKKEVVLGIK